ncbi:uncharacterized protein YnzC (UPF0291/DUF896 family) [Bacilli bacterium PM5-3]|nr:uncharacterized protein YnzC (UPF0291/DUF896 family) [Bacilli bacterium PM5-3]MDH6603018.1 uncharacterized protein YnzC (UPF0291/DUF896 family) [Bacilli bacterium PM5-9]
MIDQKLIDRINFLAKKKKTEGLNEKEQLEQDKLRKEYIKHMKDSVKNHLMSVKVVDEKGNDVTPEKLKKAKNERNKS